MMAYIKEGEKMAKMKTETEEKLTKEYRKLQDMQRDSPEDYSYAPSLRPVLRKIDKLEKKFFEYQTRSSHALYEARGIAKRMADEQEKARDAKLKELNKKKSAGGSKAKN